MTPRSVPSHRERHRHPPREDLPQPRRAHIPGQRDDPGLALRLTDRPDVPAPEIALPAGQLTLLEMGRGFQARRHASAAGNAAPLNPMEAALLAMLLEHERRIAQLEARHDDDDDP